MLTPASGLFLQHKWNCMFISIKTHCQPCASYSNRCRGIWRLAVTTVLLTLWGGLMLRRLAWALWHRTNYCSGISHVG